MSQKLTQPPLSTAITTDSVDQFGVPFEQRTDQAPASTNLSQIWANWFNLLFAVVSGVAPGGAGTCVIYELTLTAPTTNITSPVTTPAPGQQLTVKVTQDATGGRQITWSADFVISSTDVRDLPNKRTLYYFVAMSDNKWYLAANPMLEV